MAQPAFRRLPRGLNFLLVGTVIAAAFVVFAVVGGAFDFGIGSAPSVRIDTPVASVPR